MEQMKQNVNAVTREISRKTERIKSLNIEIDSKDKAHDERIKEMEADSAQMQRKLTENQNEIATLKQEKTNDISTPKTSQFEVNTTNKHVSRTQIFLACRRANISFGCVFLMLLLLDSVFVLYHFLDMKRKEVVALLNHLNIVKWSYTACRPQSQPKEHSPYGDNSIRWSQSNGILRMAFGIISIRWS
eukprot:690368_1